MRRIVVGLALALASLTGCAQNGDVGAVVVRWRLVEASSGQLSGCTVGAGGSQLTVEEIALQLTQLDGQPVPCTSCVFGCGPLEGTTNFEIPANQSYLFSLNALTCRQPVGFAPPPVMRSVKPGEVTNLNVVEILIPPCERPNCDGGAITTTCDAL